MSYEMIVKHCAPTLAGLKIGNLFSYSYDNEADLEKQLHRNNQLLNNKGIFFRILRKKNGIALVYVYRLKQLLQVLNTKDIQDFLALSGYHDFSVDECLHLLESHLTLSEFPHEIGVFLGYPLADVKAFIQNKGSNYQHVGCWKVHNNLNDALLTFEKFKKCTNIYCQKYASGYDIYRLTVFG